MKLDDENWHCLTLSRRDPKTGKFLWRKHQFITLLMKEKKKHHKKLMVFLMSTKK